jgi:hypothetical protein
MEKKKQRVVCLSFYDKNYSRGSVYLNSNYVKFYEVFFVKIDTGLKASILMIYQVVKSEKHRNTIFVVLSPCHFLVPMIRLFWRGRIVLDAGWPLTDATISRGIKPRKIWVMIKSLAIDLLSFHTASKVILESVAQSDRVAGLFRVDVKKISVLFTGFDESSISLGEMELPELADLDMTKPIVSFRGSTNPESGLEIIREMSKLSGTEEFNLLIFTNKENPGFEFSPGTQVITRRLSAQEMTKIYRMSDVLIGQISSNRRLNFTIPHKAFEAGYFEKAYISIDRPAIRELYVTSDAVSYSKNFDAKSLLWSILDLVNNVEKKKLFETHISREYREKASQELLGKRFIDLVLSN